MTKLVNMGSRLAQTEKPDYGEPLIDLEKFKQHARLPKDLTADDDLLLTWMPIAERLVESEAEIALRDQEWTLFLTRLPTNCLFDTATHRAVRFELSPVREVAVKYYDADKVLQTWDEDGIYVESDGGCPLIFVPEDLCGMFSSERPLPIRIVAQCGVESVDDIPEEAYLAMSQLMAHWYRFRECIGNLPTAEAGRVFEVWQSLINQLAWRI